MDRHADLFRAVLRPALADQGITLLRWDALSDTEQDRLHAIFAERVFPVLTPLAVDPAHPFPYISGLSLNLAVVVRNPSTGKEHFARVKVPPLLPRFVEVEPDPGDPEDAASAPTTCAPPGSSRSRTSSPSTSTCCSPAWRWCEHTTFRVTRNEDLEVEEDDAENLLQALEKELLRRRFGPPVRLELSEDVGDRRPRPAGARARRHRRRGLPLPEPLDLRGLATSPTSTGPSCTTRSSSPTHPHLTEGGDGQAEQHLRRHPPRRRAPAPPLRLVLHLGAGLPRAGRRRPARAGDQADAVPHQRRLPDRRRPHRRGRRRQAGAGPGRDQGPLRRAGQHHAGPASSSRPACTWSTASSGSRRTRKLCLVVRAGARRAARATATSARATTTPRPRGSTRTWAC